MIKADSIYTNCVLNKIDELSFLPSLSFEKKLQTINCNCSFPEIFATSLKERKRGIYYISDIHLEHRLFHKFGLVNISNSILTKYIEELVDCLLSDDDSNDIQFSIPSTILILGDTSHSFELSTIFYETLSKKLPYYEDVFVILGNHELWEFDSVQRAIDTYSDFFKRLPNIHLLHNSLFVENNYKDPKELAELQEVRSQIIFNKSMPKRTREKLLRENTAKIKEYESKFGKTEEDRHKYKMLKRIISEDTLIKMPLKKLRGICLDSKEIVFGTIGFSPLNIAMNASNGIYRSAIKTIAQEKNIASITADIYKKLVDALPKNQLIIASHMPLIDWTTLPCQDGWVYFSGHTHRNERILDERGHIYADNQVGYNGKRIRFNAVLANDRFDYFAYYKDGIFNITVNDYYMFYYGITKKMYSVDTRGGVDYKIIMLKNKGMYLFLFQNEVGKLFLLEGGKRRVVNNQDINYYYNNMTLLNQAIAKSIEDSGIKDFLEKLAAFVKSIGGSGHLHGNIIDIDFFNHIRVDFRDFKVIPYYAYSVNDRYEYPDLPKLLQDNRPDLYTRFIENGGSDSLPTLNDRTMLSKTIEHTTDTSFYNDSNIMLKIQDMFNYNVIRFWNDDLIDSINKKFKKYLDSGEVKKLIE